MERVTIIGTGLIGASVGLALRSRGFAGEIVGWDSDASELKTALEMGAIGEAARSEDAAIHAAQAADVVVLAVPVMGILDWMRKLAMVMGPRQLLTDVGSTKLEIVRQAKSLYSGKTEARFLAGHPMAGKESGGAALAEANLFEGAMWLFTPRTDEAHANEKEWREWVTKFGCRTMEMRADRHDEMCAWVSHLPQMVATAMSAMFEEKFGGDEELRAVGGRALREMTRLGASPYSMWRDVAMTNTAELGKVLLEFEQRLGHVRENLRSAQLRDEFAKANAFKGR